MKIIYLELMTKDLQIQKDFYSKTLELPLKASDTRLEVQAGQTTLVFTQAELGFNGAYHFAFNIPENQLFQAIQWSDRRFLLLHDDAGKEVFESKTWNSHSVYFKDPAGNVLEFIARHTMDNAVEGDFDSRQIINISEIGLPSEDVIGLANDLCTKLELSVFRQEPNETFTPIGDNDGLFILPIKGRIWMPQSGVPAKLLPIKVKGIAGNREWEVRGVPYEII